jgi:2-hydroxy-3-keto-5-methylthiopentenyl-1-phosphate phosphatase
MTPSRARWSEIDLSSTAVFLDFDGTISVVDTCVCLLDHFAGEAWHEVEALYDANLIGSRECLIREWALIATRDEAVLRSVAAHVSIDPGFGALVAALHHRGAEVSVGYDGFEFYVRECCPASGFPWWPPRSIGRPGRSSFPPGADTCPCAMCGTCKLAPVRAAAATATGRATVFIGDGTSDRLVAPVADFLYAKGDLAAWCRPAGHRSQELHVVAGSHRKPGDLTQNEWIGRR